MALDPRYVTGFELEQYLVDKATGAPLANGSIFFWQDDARAVPKLVYQLTGAPPNYTYTALPNPIILSSVGTIQDAAGNNVALYYFPYDALGNLQLYYVTVYDQFGTPQFVREGWPNITGNENQNLTEANISNELTNPQFAVVNFIRPTNIINITGAGTFNILIAPGWTLNVTATGATTVTVTQNPITGVTAYPYNPPYTLTVTPGLNITGLTLSQRLSNNPSIWSPQPGGANGWVATSILLAPLSSVTINYAPSTGPAQQLLTSNNLSGVYAEARNTVQLTAANNTDNSNVGYVDIIIVLPPAAITTLSNVQVVGLETNEMNVVYEQTPVNRQIDFMFHYYNPLLQYKPIPSYLIGWDFPLNPAQFLTPTVAAIASGANTSNYFWDQTIIFQTTNSGVSAAQGADGSLVLTSAAVGGTQLALVQYLPFYEVNEMLTTYLSCMVKAHTNNPGGIPITISLWYTTGTLPHVAPAAYQSIVATLNADGSVATTHAGSQPWVQIARSNLGNATFTLANGATYLLNGFQGWLDTTGGSATATNFAIVVGTGVLAHTNTLTIQSISCVPGQIPTIPAPQSASAVYQDCRRFYQTTFLPGTLPAQGIGANTGYYSFPSTKAGATAASIGTFIPFIPIMNTTPAITYYNPINMDAQVADITTSVSCTASVTANLNNNGFYVDYTGDAGGQIGYTMGVHYTADSRLGL